MPNSVQSVFLQEKFLQKESKETVSSSVKKVLSYCFIKSRCVLFAIDTLFLIIFFGSFNPIFLESQFSGIALLVLGWMFLAYIMHQYSKVLIDEAENIVKKAFSQWSIFVLIAGVLYTPFFNHAFGRKEYFLSLVAFGGVLLLNRLAFLSIRKKYKHLIVRNRKIAIIGNNQYFDTFEQYVKNGSFGYKIAARFIKAKFKINSDEAGCSDICLLSKKGISELYCNLEDFSKVELQQILTEADKCMVRVKFIPPYLNLIDRNVSYDKLGDIPVINVRTEPLSKDRNKLAKRLFDICFSLFVIVFILSWLLPIIWIVVKLESKGPLLFKQNRSGMDNKSFACFKFRSMTANNNGADKVQCTKGDKRITKVGAFLRKTSLDELPQFFNVLKGEMSVVGPRPHMLAHTDQYRQQIATYMIRHYAKPGITGLAQVSGSRGETKELSAMQKRVEYDINYIESWSFFFDLKIIFLTVWNIVKGEENAY